VRESSVAVGDEKPLPLGDGEVEEASFYMPSDGLIDQVGGQRRRMFGKKRSMNFLLEIQEKPMSYRKDIILQALSTALSE